ncbi:hypothetical protein TgHK011_001632 [Trichoderma gracile]|nr:hypothetical protein TgHK011_001632 [Trichoderma gracile]
MAACPAGCPRSPLPAPRQRWQHRWIAVQQATGARPCWAGLQQLSSFVCLCIFTPQTSTQPHSQHSALPPPASSSCPSALPLDLLRTAASAPVAAQFRVSASASASGTASCPGPVPICAKAIIIPH